MEQEETEHNGNYNNAEVAISPGPGYTKELGDLNFKVGSGTDYGFWKHTINSKNYYQCGYYERNSNNEIFWCYYDQRADHHRSYAGVHVHKTKNPDIFGPLDKHIRRSTTHINTRYDIYSKMAHFTATANLSLNKGCSDDLFQIIYASLNFYRKNYQQYSKTPTEEIIPKIGPEKIREIMIETADKILNQAISHMQYSRYISICLDGGQTGARHFINFVVWSRKKSFSVFIKDTESLTAEGYAHLALECLNHDRLSTLKDKITCFIGDGLRAQVAGLDPESSEAFQHKKGIGNFSKIMFSPCFNHRLQNSFKKTYREMKLFKNIVNNINKLAIFLRKPAQVKTLKKICPEPIVTRWQYIFNICIFLSQNIECIKDIISSQETETYNIDFDLDFFIKILHPLRSATLLLSDNRCSLGDVYPIITEVINQYEKLKENCKEKDYLQIINTLIVNVKYYTTTSPQQSLILLAYVLTPQGRSAIYQMENHRHPENEEIYTTFKNLQLPDLLLNQSAEKKNDETNIEALLDLVTEEQTQTDDIEFLKQKDDDAELEQQNEKGSAYEKCREAIGKLIKYLKISVFEQQNLYKRLHEWLNLAHNDIPFYELIGEKENPMAFWEEIIKAQTEEVTKWKVLADIALRLDSIAATETNCERAISLQGFIAKDRSQKSKPDLQNARLIHLQNNK